MRQVQKLVAGVLAALGLICLITFSAQAQLHIGGGVRLQNNVPYTVFVLQNQAQVAELSWAISAAPLITPVAQLRVTARIMTVLMRWQFEVTENISLYPTLGGLVTEAIYAGWNGQKEIAIFARGEGILGGVGTIYQFEDFPLHIFANVLYTYLPMPFLPLPNGNGIENPSVGGITEWSWTVGVQYTFDLSKVLETLDNR